MRRFAYISFPWVIVAAGVITLAIIIGNLTTLGLRRHPAEPRKHVPGGDVTRGKEALRRYGCGGCHVIPGVLDAVGRVGPKLSGIVEQSFVGGVLANTPDNMVSWIRSPQQISPRTAMPDLGVSEAEARDMAAYLYQH